MAVHEGDATDGLRHRLEDLEVTCRSLRAQLIEREAFWQQAERRALALAAASQVFVDASADFEQLVQTIAQRAGELLGTGCAVLLVTEDRKRLTLAGVYDSQPGGAQLMQRMLTTRPVLVGEGLTGKVVATGKSIKVDEVSKEQLEQAFPPEFRVYLEEVTSLSLLGVPIRADDEVIGALALARRPPAPRFDAGDQTLAEDLAARFGVCLSRARILFRLEVELAERERAERLLASTEEQLRQARRLESIGLLAGGIAHDFNNLLTVILGTTDLLSSDVPQGHAWRTDLDAIASAGRRARDLTSQLLAFSRKQVLQPTILNANELLAATELLLKRVIGENIELKLELQPRLPLFKVDRAQLEQCLMNLVANARDAMPAGGQITFVTQAVQVYGTEDQLGDATPGAYVKIAVCDTGEGIDEESRQRLFEPFFTTKESGKGTGLGLAAVYGIVKQSAGYITVHSTPRVGTTFTIYLPVAEAIAAKGPDSTASREHRIYPGEPRTSGTVLVVEDEEHVRQIVRRVLEASGYTVLTAANVGEATAIARNQRIDLLLSDVVLTQSNGPALAAGMRAIRPDLKVLFMTGYTDPALVAEHTQLHASVLHKPFTPNALLNRVRDVLQDHVSYI